MTSFDPPSSVPEVHASVTPEATTPLGASTTDASSAVAATSTSSALPTMGDLDRLAAALDQVDRTLVELDESSRLAQV